jgi:protein kinase-like protein
MQQPVKIGRYEIKSELGRGGMATVYRGYDPLFEREVAVKVLPSELLHSDPQFKLRFEREAKIIASLEHPSIVPVYDVGDDNGQPYFVMRYMSGGSLSDRIKAKVLTIDEAVKILGQLAPGMDEAHSKGIIHRDLKPSNILFDGKGVPYISDFGIAKLSQAQSGNVTGSAIIGTPAYMAPEQAQGTGVDGRTDIYAVGIILFEMLTGRQPYEADTPMAVAFKHITDPVPQILLSNPNLPEDVEPIIQTAMAKNKDDRFATAGDLVESLRAVGAGQRFLAEQPTARGAIPAGKSSSLPTVVKSVASRTIKADEKIAAAPAKPGFNIWLAIIPLVLLGVIGGGYAIFSGMNRSVATEAPVETSTSAATEVSALPAATEIVATEPVIDDTPTATVPSVTDTPAAPTLTVIGGADKIALVADSEIWMMNVDGSNREQLTFDHATKNDLQWLPDGETILFLSGKTIKYYNITTATVDTLTSFPSEATLDAFQVSHDGKQVMIAMSNEIFVVPFDFETLRTITNRNRLVNLEGVCLLPTPKTPAALRVQEARWSADDKLVAWLFKGNDPGNAAVQAEQVSVFDISACKPELIDLKDNFPGTRFTPIGFQNREMPDFDWDGSSQFVFNTSRRNEGWGELYIYNWTTHKPTLVFPGKCCYRDSRWSPDGTYILIEFQDAGLGPEATSVLYYIPVGELSTGANFVPIAMPEGFFKNPKEGAQAALRPARP